MVMATLLAAIAAAVVRCSTISKARPAPGSNVRSASRPARRRHRPRRWFRRLSHKNQACGWSWCTPKSAWPMSAPSASRPWIACAHGSQSSAALDGRLKAAEKVGAAATRVLARNHGHRYYDWSYDDGVFRFFEHPVHFAREQAYEGKYVIQTEEPNLSRRGTPLQRTF